MVTIYHNPRCSKSREGVKFLESLNVKFTIVEYLKNALTEKDLQELLIQLNIPAIDLVRKKELIWKENYALKKRTEKELIKVMIENPKLIERPIVVNKNKAVIGRPTENIKEIL